MGGMWGMGTKACTCEEPRVMYGGVESLYCAPENNITLYWNLKLKFKKIKKK